MKMEANFTCYTKIFNEKMKMTQANFMFSFFCYENIFLIIVS